ncbi:MAG: hypothetical protein KKH61_21290 [Gammaproteobacteria bacterium]|uniref:Uncharacterized protein n=1 Tax=viral metagenome TaxID=1070528 RepID=A0A6H1ZBS7_9ZZZZ|nr:hypothetical protein [Gammaproteobacteria bacterium]
MATAETTTQLKKDGTPKAKRGEGAGSKPRPAYLVYSLDENGDLVIHSATRKADEVLAETAGQSVKKYARFEI